MPNILIVDDSKVDQRVAGALVEAAGMTTVYADDGRAALELMHPKPPDLVLTDMMMPEIDGLALVEAIRKEYSNVPVILMTAHGSEETAAAALRRGAASYVPKKFLAQDLLETMQQVLAAASGHGPARSAVECLTQTQCRFVLGCDTAQIRPVVRYVEQDIARMNLCDDTGITQLGMALSEAINNAVEHGNLGVKSDLRESDFLAYMDLVQQRKLARAYAERRVFVQATASTAHVEFVVRDEGEGFNPLTLSNPLDPANLGKVSGRGLLLIRTFMDEVRHNTTGNEITMIKQAAPPPAATT